MKKIKRSVAKLLLRTGWALLGVRVSPGRVCVEGEWIEL